MKSIRALHLYRIAGATLMIAGPALAGKVGSLILVNGNKITREIKLRDFDVSVGHSHSNDPPSGGAKSACAAPTSPGHDF